MSEIAQLTFDKCPTRTIKEKDLASRLFSVCRRYPNGVELKNSNVFVNSGERGAFAQKLGCVACPYRKQATVPERITEGFKGFHESIVANCQPKFEAGHYDDAILTGMLVIRDRLRDLTGFETASDAFGRGGLIIAGAANQHTENNFQEGAKFIMMANDKFRNELAHTVDQNDLIKDPNIALQFIGMSSISAFMLDGARVVVG